MNTEDRELFKLEQELRKTEKKLEREKIKRFVILFFVYSVLGGLLLYEEEKPIDPGDIINFLTGVLFVGGGLYLFSTLSHILVSTLFTKIDSLESWKKYLENEISKRK